MSRLFSFEGRATRAEFWAIFLPLFLIGVGIQIWFKQNYETAPRTDYFSPEGALLVLGSIVVLAWVQFALFARRYHDLNKSGSNSWKFFIPIVGQIWVIIELGCFKGSIATNNYGLPRHGRLPDPLPHTASDQVDPLELRRQIADSEPPYLSKDHAAVRRSDLALSFGKDTRIFEEELSLFGERYVQEFRLSIDQGHAIVKAHEYVKGQINSDFKVVASGAGLGAFREILVWIGSLKPEAARELAEAIRELGEDFDFRVAQTRLTEVHGIKFPTAQKAMWDRLAGGFDHYLG